MSGDDKPPGANVLRYLADRYGHRGAALIALGALWVILGVSALFTVDPVRPWVFLDYLPPFLTFVLWGSSGAVAIYVSLCSPDCDDTFGMVALLLMPMMRFMAFAFAWLVYLGTSVCDAIAPGMGEPVGYANGLWPALAWLLVMVLLRLIAGWPNPRKVLVLPTGEPR